MIVREGGRPGTEILFPPGGRLGAGGEFRSHRGQLLTEEIRLIAIRVRVAGRLVEETAPFGGSPPHVLPGDPVSAVHRRSAKSALFVTRSPRSVRDSSPRP
ncbi:hypothetical protein [Embleya sp. NPDC020630]|uniref:hypothetical protein n=1 Tax=Embleya sp. NPDC020630 TaxID=3363979 RepID=UPI0037B2CE3C